MTSSDSVAGRPMPPNRCVIIENNKDLILLLVKKPEVRD
jgi:hypothetical protein